jgi:hypothetical protein
MYQLAIAGAPSGISPFFGQILLICHKSFLAAATLIGQAQPDDAGPITRRAIEAVRLAAALKDDPTIAEKWVAHETRTERWQARREGTKPPRLHVEIPVKHPLVKELMESWGMLSDSDVHFTPEYLISQQWKEEEDSLFLQYFSGDQDTIERAVIHLLGAHMMMLRVLDDCMEGAISRNAQWVQVSKEIHAVAGPYAERFEHSPIVDEVKP